MIFGNASAQYCGNSGPHVCTPQGGLSGFGFYPSDTSLPCVSVGQAYAQQVNLVAPTAEDGFTLDSIRVNSLTNLPCGLCWASSSATNTIAGGGTACIVVQGTSFDAPGEYNVLVYATAYVDLFGASVPLGPLNADSALGLYYYVRVHIAGDTCVHADTVGGLGREASTPGTIATPSISGGTSICSGPTTLTATGGNYYAFAWSNGSFNPSITVSEAGTYTVTVYDNCTSATASVVVTGGGSASIQANGPTTFCQGGSVTLTASQGDSYKWSSGQTTQSITVTTTGSYDATVTSGGCPATSNAISVTVTPLPNIYTVTGGTICSSGTISLTGSDKNVSYQLFNGATPVGSPVAGTGNVITFGTQSTLGTYTVEATATGTSCNAVMNDSAIIAAPPTVFNVTGGTGCGSVTIGLSGSQKGVDYQLYDNGVIDGPQVPGTGNTLSFGPQTGQGNYIVIAGSLITGCQANMDGSANVTNEITSTIAASICAGASYDGHTESGVYVDTFTVTSGCDSIRTLQLTVQQVNATITASGDTTFCQGGSVTLSATPESEQTYLWSNRATTSSITVSTSGSYTLTVTTVQQCIAVSNTIVVTAIPTPNATITASGSLGCSGGSVTLSVPKGNNTGYNYYWGNTNGGTYPDSNAISVTAAGDYEVDVTDIVNGVFCQAIGYDTVTSSGGGLTATITASGDTTFCAGGSVTLSVVNPGAGSTFAWSNNATTSSITASETGAYRVTVTSGSCQGVSNEIKVTVKPQPTVTITSSGSLSCGGGAVTLSIDSVPGDTTAWTDVTTGIVVSESHTVTVTTPGVYIVTLSEPLSEGAGCTASAYDTVTSSGGGLQVSITASGDTNFCQGGSVTLSVVDPGLTGSYLWSDGETTSSITVTASGGYSVVETAGGCSGTSNNINVFVIPAPNAAITASGVLGCTSGGSVTLSVPAGNGLGYNYNWFNATTGQGGYPDANSITVTAAGVYEVDVTYSAFDLVCSSSGLDTVTANGAPPVAICKNATIDLIGDTAVLTPVKINNGSYAACGIAFESVSPSVFTAVAKKDSAYLTIIDSAGNTATCGAKVKVIDASDFDWTKKACLPGAGRSGVANFAIGDTGYVVCGITENAPAIAEVWAYCQSTNTWTQKGNFPGGARAIPTGLAIDSFGYVGLGLDASGNYHNDFWQYNPRTDSWTQVANFPGAPRYTAMRFGINGIGYVGCGKGSGTYSDFYAYNPATNTWSSIPDFPGGARQTGFGAAVNGIGYVGMGYVGGNAFNDMYAYSPASKSWTQVASYPGGGIYALTGFAIRNILYTAAGRNNTDFFTECWAYNPGDNKWTQQQSFSCIAPPRSTWEGFAIKGHGYVACGGDNTNHFNDLLEFGPDDTTFTTQTNILGPDLTVCGNSSEVLSIGTTCGLWSTGTTGSSINVTGPGTYWVRYADSCGMNADTIHITQGSSLQVTISPAGPITACTGTSVTLDAGAGYNSYLWSDGETTETINVTVSGYYSCSVSQGACSGQSDTVRVVFLNLPNPIIKTSGNLSFCTGDSVVLDAGSGFQTYIWSDGETTESITVTQSGNYSVIVGAAGCTAASDTVTVTVTSPPVAVISPVGPVTACTGSSVTLDAGAGYTSYLWNDGETTETISVTATGSYYCTVAQGSCIGSSDTVAVRFLDLPAPIIKNYGNVVFCQGDSVTLNAGSGYATYLWNNGQTTQTIAVYQGGTFYCTVTAGGCTAYSDTISVVEISNPIVTVNPPGPVVICAGTEVTLTASVAPGSSLTSYSWTNGATSAIITTGAGNYNCTVTTGGCTGVSNTVVISLSTTPPNAVCKTDTVTLNNGTASITPADIDGGSTASCGIAGETVSQSTFTETGVYDVTLFVTDSNGNSANCTTHVVVINKTECFDPFTCTITSVPIDRFGLPDTADPTPETIYIGYGPQSTRLRVTESRFGFFTYSWSPATGLSCTDCAAPVFTPTEQGLYTFTVTVTSALGCTSTCTITICVLDVKAPNGQPIFGFPDTSRVYLCQEFTVLGHTYSITFALPALDAYLYLQYVPDAHIGKCGQSCDNLHTEAESSDGDGKDGSNAAQFIPGDGANGFALLVYPNPFSSQFHLHVITPGTDPINVRVMDVTGRVIMEQQNIAANSDVLTGEGLARGMYLVEVTQGNNRQVVKMTKGE